MDLSLEQKLEYFFSPVWLHKPNLLRTGHGTDLVQFTHMCLCLVLYKYFFTSIQMSCRPKFVSYFQFYVSDGTCFHVFLWKKKSSNNANGLYVYFTESPNWTGFKMFLKPRKWKQSLAFQAVKNPWAINNKWNHIYLGIK